MASNCDDYLLKNNNNKCYFFLICRKMLIHNIKYFE